MYGTAIGHQVKSLMYILEINYNSMVFLEMKLQIYNCIFKKPEFGPKIPSWLAKSFNHY